MSDFFSRLAARSVGDAPEARPSRGLDVSATPAAARAAEPVAAPEVVRATPAAPEVRSEVPETPVAENVTPAESAAEAPSVAPVQRAEPRDAAVPAQRKPQPAQPQTQERTEPAAPPAPLVVPAAPVAAAPIVRHTAETRLQRIHSVATVAADDPPVRVHIGRLEVRANLEQPAPKPQAEKAKAEGLSLGEYLRGKRTA